MLQKADVAEVLAAEGRRSGSKRAVVVVAAIAAVIVFAGAGVWAWSALQSRPLASFATDAVARGDLVVTLVATGTLQPTKQVSVSALTTGTVASVDVDYNQTVSSGQALAHLDMSDLEPRLRRAMAMVDVQTANRDAAATAFTDAQSALTRAQSLTSGENVTVRDTELATTAAQRAKSNLAATDAQLKAAQADLATAESDYAKGTITSPIDGIVLDINAEVGDTITSSALVSSLFTVAGDLRALDLEVDVDEADVAQVKAGDKVAFTVEAAPDKPLAAVVRQVRAGPTVSNGITSYKAVIRVDNSSLLLKPGMTATAEISTDEAHDVLTVANAALRFTPATAPSSGGMFGSLAPHPTAETPSAGEQHVYVLRDGKLQPITVTVGLTDGQRTQITGGGLAAGDLVVTGAKGR